MLLHTICNKYSISSLSCRIVLATLLSFLACHYSMAQNDSQDENIFTRSHPKHEIRAVWLTTIKNLDWPKTRGTDAATEQRQKQELINILDALQKANINTVILQTRLRGSVIYPSAIEPWDECFSGKPGKAPNYDPLKFVIDECHKRGMELHAWIVSIPLGTVQGQRAYGNASIMKRSPEVCKAVGANVFMRPDASGTAPYIARLCKEITDNYDVDGISLDYIRYPESTFHYSDNATAQQRRDYITSIVRAVHDAIKPTKPWVKLSSSPIGKFNNLSRYKSPGWNAYSAVYQDAQLWLKENIQDVLFPMMYFRENHFYPYLFDWKEHTYDHPVVPGLGIYFLDPREGNWTLNDVRAEMHTIRNTEVGGIAFYRSDFFTRNCRGLYDATCAEFFPYPALTPAMTWMDNTVKPESPNHLQREKDVLSWQGQQQNVGDGNYVYYNIYGSNVYPVDIDDAANLVATRQMGTTYNLTGRATKFRYFAVTASTRLGIESEAAQEQDILNIPDSKNAWNPCSRLGVNGTRMDDRMQLLRQSKS